MAEAVSRFEREAVLAGSINHPNVAAATDFGKLPDGSFFLVLELVVGKSLRALIAEGPLDVSRAHAIMRGMAAGIAAAHAKGIVHRDLKPDNVMLVERDGVPDFVKVLDFGIAKGSAMPEEAPESGVPQLTKIGAIMGTPDYMSPEQALGQPVDARSDLYSLGVIWFELLTGAPPFQGDALQVLRHHLMTEPPVIPAERVAGAGVPLGEIVRKLLGKEPEARFQTAAELLAALDGAAARASAGAGAGARAGAGAGAEASGEAGPKSEAREDDGAVASGPPRRLVVGAASLGVLVLVMVVVAILFGRRDPVTAEGDATGMVQAGAELPSEVASAAATEETAPETTPSASASSDGAETAEGSASASPSAARAAAPPAPAAGRAGRGGRGRPGRQPAPRRRGVFSPLKDLFK